MIIFLIFFTFFYFSFKYFNFYGIYGVPGSIQINLIHLIKYYISLFRNNSNDKYTEINYNFNNNYTTVYGYCSRQLFNTFILNFKEENKDKNINIGVTPIHHTSYRNIIEKNFPQENIHIFDTDNKYENILIPKDKKNIKYDLILITHLWGKYLNIDNIKNNFKNSIIIEDSILAGKYVNEFRNNSDLLFHSCGMDKRPSSIFGAYVHIKNKRSKIIKSMINSINKLPLPTKKDVFKKIYDITILYSIYNIRVVQNIAKMLIYLSGNKLSNIISIIRKSKPGFEHSNYMKRPNNLMIKINKNIYNTHKYAEKIFIKKNKLFLSQFTIDQRRKYFPWNIKNDDSCLPYNPIYIEKINHLKIVNYFDENNICIINNPTYKTFEHSSDKIKVFLNNIFYLPNLHKLKNNEIIDITNHLKKIFKKFK